MVRIIYHSADFDGHASGAIARYYFEYINGDAYTMHGYNYGQPFPHDEFYEDDHLVFLDVTYQPNNEMMEWEEKYGYKITIVDHHKTVVDSPIMNHITGGGVLDTSNSACELAWKYFFSDQKMPKVIELLGRYDIWDKEDSRRWNNIIIPFQMGFKLFKTNPSVDDFFNKTWLYMFDMTKREMNEFVDEVIYKGKFINKYQASENKRIASGYAIEATFHGRPVIVLNSPQRSSSIFDSVWDENKYDFMLVWSYTKYGDIGVSMYTTRVDVDVSEIAKMHGGGGHQQAAGFGATDITIKDSFILFE